MIEFVKKAEGRPSAIAILPGAFHPPTVAHLALGRAALSAVDEVLFVLPRTFPHKRYERVGFDQRMEMLAAAVAGEPRFSAGSSEGGLFIDIAREAHAAYGPETRVFLLCGSDAAERIVNWDYGRPGAIREQFAHFDLLVASRKGEYVPPPELAAHIHPLMLNGPYDEISATEVRRRIACGENWETLVPESVHNMVRSFYLPDPAD